MYCIYIYIYIYIILYITHYTYPEFYYSKVDIGGALVIWMQIIIIEKQTVDSVIKDFTNTF